MATKTRMRGGDAIARKADAKLGHVAQLWCEALGSCCSAGEVGVLERELVFSNISEIQRVVLSYEIKAKLFATLFDLVYSFEVSGCAPNGAKVFLLDGANGFGCSIGSTAKKLNEFLPGALFRDRVRDLGITKMEAVFVAEEALWHIRMVGLVGSSTWNLLPPVLQLIEPRRDECVRATELMRMIGAALARCDCMEDGGL
ncbi:hypothetical protein [Gordonibacter massiliensis (ex Traore et al. 2017)]|uniref:Uncharacterized protein n=1 Tax=Gordonibacter massiliensis (ex Traore et al. 2017) TaxID=1841863 RepID=A0A842JFW1_9ACTN|nr:hypothetical protein [Gordonibacter massiliensis (ex Traore et al. 2017)]MBC2890324.1 hypothetical protein [Gordonibacter massiliensis (ex Traore et al. 2017)]